MSRRMLPGIVDEQCSPDMNLDPAKIRGYGSEISELHFGETYFVNANSLGNVNIVPRDISGGGKSPMTPFATLKYAVTVAAADSLIIVAQNHTETIAVASCLACANVGVRIKGVGTRYRRPTITIGLGGAVTNVVLLDKASTVIENMNFQVGLDSLNKIIDITAPGVTIRNCRVGMALESAIANIGIDISNAAADEVSVVGCEVTTYNAAGTVTVGADSGIKISAAVNHPIIVGNEVFGDFTDAGIHNPTSAVALNAEIHHNHVVQLQTGDHAIEIVSAVTGELHDNRCWADTPGVVILGGSMKQWANETSDCVNGVHTCVRATALPPQGAIGSLFTVASGYIEILNIVGEVTTTIGAVANATKLIWAPTAGTAPDEDLCATLDINGLLAGQIFAITGLAATAMAAGPTGTNGIIVGPGPIQLNCAGSSVTGAIKWTIVFRKVDNAVTVVAA